LEKVVIGEIRDIEEIVSRHLPLSREAAKEPSASFAQSRRLQALAINRHLQNAGEVRDYLDEYVTVPGREIPIRIYVQERAGPTTIYFHGGGWVSGNLDTHHGFCQLLRESLGGVVVSVHTRRAPENRFPAQIDDAICAADFLLKRNGLVEVGPEGLILAGDSAGAFIAFHSALQLSATSLLRGLLLFYPALDTDFEKLSYSQCAEAPGLSAATMRLYWDALLGHDNVLRQSLSLDTIPGLNRLPLTAIMVAEHDPLRDDGVKLGALLKEISHPAVSILARDATHGFCRLVQHDPEARAWAEVLLAEFSALLR
jgi:acetyl esterase